MMEKEHKDRLQRAWLPLLNTVGDVIRVIDGLFTKNIITRLMKERIVQGNAVHSDKLRALMDLLPRRGPEAFDAFYDVLIEQEEFDAADYLKPELKGQHKTRNDDLPKKWPDRDVHDPDHIKVSLVADKEMIQNFENAYSDEIYPMCRAKRGIFLLIDNQNFYAARAAGIKLADRDGTEFDQTALHSLFEALDFKVEIKDNCSAKQIADALQEVARKSHRDFDCFACAILSHGEQGVVFGVDGDKILIKDIIGAMDGVRCPTLIGKPKLFFVQACQGNKYDKGVSVVKLGDAAGDMPTGDSVSTGDGVSTGADVSTVADHMKNMTMQDAVQHKEELDVMDLYNLVDNVLNKQCDNVSNGKTGTKCDIFLAMATSPDYVSIRNTKFGSWFIQAVAYVFSKFAHKNELLHLMIKVNRLVSRAETREGGYKQVSGFNSKLTKELYFFPGLKKQVPSPRPETSIEPQAQN
ncbi:hypothetical protein C0Q70_02295 [Pomacea canaliculata]|uniref:Uncharacterized protein n=1 Tax=Pomacea canaliculata TaxID=400727 RepID=A0A2T7PPK0_POMCA|nr:hypothetical protein C0Q70_02295 [Pomacea canaliculata]